MSLQEELMAERSFLSNLQSQMKQERKRRLMVQGSRPRVIRKKAGSGKNYYYGADKSGKTVPLTSSELWKLVYIEFLEESQRRIEKNIKCLEKAAAGYIEYNPQELYAHLRRPYDQAYLDLSNESSASASGAYAIDEITGILKISGTEEAERDSFREEGLRHVTGDGTLVRSKSEASIADHLWMNHISYEYEPELYLGDHIVRPDFRIHCPFKRKILYWEHFGMLDDPLYVRSTSEKLLRYLESGYLPFDNLIITCERNGRINTGVIQRIIDTMIL